MCKLSRKIVFLVLLFGGCDQIITKIQKNDQNIQLKLYTSNNSDPYQINIGNIANVTIDPASSLEILIHGWRETSNDPWIILMKDTLLENGSKNVLTVDWKWLAGKKITNIIWEKLNNEGILSTNECNILADGVSDEIWSILPRQIYKNSAENIPIVGKYVGELLISLAEAKNINIEDIRIRGFSLGAHVAGSIGKTIKSKTGKKIGRITGMDPAGPLFRNVSAANRLDKDDAMFTDVIHTNGRLFGLYNPIGHVNFYPNGGCIQMCKFDETEFAGCSHALAFKYFTESIKSNKFISTLCDSYENFSRGNCNHGQKVAMGYQLKGNVTSGKYYLYTNTYPPYARGEET
ncbi:hepatic triacylglycerol lipase-like [Chrysoperla carnea]|uniref:hepatic triacylglycerol lipase-like n=1 Tax=Chrysoperla carnea TaxID=189513 RepID=UPI001D0830D5|nr:hepatic triacylglycerol lipase-like [Chrysoperla carnea]